jgi:glycosyltransferase involved in cell wall biosynthesis
VVHALPPASYGGVELHVQGLLNAQSGRHQVSAFGPEAGGSRSFLERTRFAPAEKRFRQTLADLRPDVVHVHHLAHLSAGILGIAADAGARVVLTIHDHAIACPRGQRIRLDLDPCPVLDRERCVKCVHPALIEAVRSPDRLRALMGLFRPGEGRRLFEVRDAHLRLNLDRVAAFIAPSRSAADLFLEYYPAAGDRMRVIPHGFAREEAPAPMRPRGPGEPFTAGYFGSVIPSKGVFVLADAAALLGDEARIVLNGTGSGTTLAGLARRSRGRLENAGPYRPENLAERMGRVHAVLVPSLWAETFSIVVREAWTHRRPVLASATGALVEAAGPDQRRAGLVAPGDPAAWAAAIRRLKSDAAWYAELSGPHEPEPFTAMLSAIEACYTSRS